MMTMSIGSRMMDTFNTPTIDWEGYDEGDMTPILILKEVLFLEQEN